MEVHIEHDVFKIMLPAWCAENILASRIFKSPQSACLSILLFQAVCKMHRKYLTISICNNSVLCNSFITYNYACEGVDFFNLPTVSGQNTPFLVLYLVPSNVNFMVLRICNLFSLKHLYILNEVNVLLCVYLW